MTVIPKKEITDVGDIRLLVETFYNRAKSDDLLGPVFANKFNGHPHAIDPLYKYWETILLDQEPDIEVPFLKHAELPLTHQHFDRWLSVFHQTVDDLFTGAVADKAKFRAIRMSEVFRYKMELTNF